MSNTVNGCHCTGLHYFEEKCFSDLFIYNHWNVLRWCCEMNPVCPLRNVIQCFLHAAFCDQKQEYRRLVRLFAWRVSHQKKLLWRLSQINFKNTVNGNSPESGGFYNYIVCFLFISIPLLMAGAVCCWSTGWVLTVIYPFYSLKRQNFFLFRPEWSGLCAFYVSNSFVDLLVFINVFVLSEHA